MLNARITESTFVDSVQFNENYFHRNEYNYQHFETKNNKYFVPAKDSERYVVSEQVSGQF
jgi:hypothetical protein